MSDRESGRLRRIARLGGLTARVTTSYVGQKVKETFQNTELRQRARDRLHIDNALDIVQTVGNLKGAAMKVGQQVAMYASQLDLPEEVSSTLAQLHANAEPVPFQTIKEDIESSLGMPLHEAFSSVDPEPIGTASLGQVHGATLTDGTDVVIKVLHRGVQHSVTTDLMALKGMLIGSRVLRRSKKEMDDLFDEIRDRLEEELDYVHEAANITAYHQAFGDDPRFRIPQYYPDLSSERVLTLERLPGQHAEEFAASATPVACHQAGLHLAEFYYEQVFVHRMLHADPHPGNYLFEPDGRMGIIDFGCVRRYDEFWTAKYARVALAVVDLERQLTLDLCVELDSWDGKKEKAGEALWAFAERMGAGYRAGEVTIGGPEESLMEDIMPAMMGLARYPEVRLPKNLVMLHRSLGGIYHLQRHLKPTADWGALLRRHATHAIAVAEGRA